MPSLTDALDTAFTAYDKMLRQPPDKALMAAMKAAEDAEKDKATAPPPVAKKKLAAAMTAMITRPNGEGYLPRKIKVDDEVTTDVVITKTAYNGKLPILFYGPPGCGKTALVEAALPGLITLQGTAQTEAADFIGSWVQRTDGMYQWEDGPLVKAMEGGQPLLIDEIALIDSRELAVVYSVMDGRNELPITANPARGTVKVKEGFLVFGACNPNVPGAIMSDALLSRFALHVEVKTDWSLAEKLGVPMKIITVARNLETKYDSAEIMAAPQLRELLNFVKVTTEFGEAFALRNFVAQARPEDRPTYTDALNAVFGTKVKALIF